MNQAEDYFLTTNRTILRPFIENDLENVYKGLSHPDIIKYYGVSYSTLEETKLQMNFFSDLVQNGTGRWWAICSNDHKLFYGAGGLNSLSKEHKKAEIGFWLLKDFWGKGLMTEVIPVICKFGFEQMDLHRIEGIVETENISCKKAMKKLGFDHEGTMKECEIKNGKFISLEIYAMLNKDGI